MCERRKYKIRTSVSVPEGLKVSLTSVVLPESRVSLFDSKSGSSMGTTRSNVRSLVIDVESLGQKHVYQNTPNRRSNGGFLFIVRPKTKLHYWRAVHLRSSCAWASSHSASYLVGCLPTKGPQTYLLALLPPRILGAPHQPRRGRQSTLDPDL